MAINYDRVMISLVQKIRKQVEIKDKPKVKLANSNLLADLRQLYFLSENVTLKALIEELYSKAGEELKQETESNTAAVKVYRGHIQQDMTEEKTNVVKSERLVTNDGVEPSLSEKAEGKSEKKVKMYRGHRVEDKS